MDYDKNYIECSYNPEELNNIFIKEFIKFRRENNLTQELFSKYSDVTREKIARIELRYALTYYFKFIKNIRSNWIHNKNCKSKIKNI